MVKFANLVAQKSEGKIKVRGYSDGQLGAGAQSFRAGRCPGNESGVQCRSDRQCQGIRPLRLPLALRRRERCACGLDGPVGTLLLDKLTDCGVVGLCYREVEFRHATNSKHPLVKLEDFQSLKIRTIQNPVFVDVFNTLGANASPMAFTEVYAALESKALDGPGDALQHHLHEPVP